MRDIDKEDGFYPGMVLYGSANRQRQLPEEVFDFLDENTSLRDWLEAAEELSKITENECSILHQSLGKMISDSLAEKVKIDEALIQEIIRQDNGAGFHADLDLLSRSNVLARNLIKIYEVAVFEAEMTKVSQERIKTVLYKYWGTMAWILWLHANKVLAT